MSVLRAAEPNPRRHRPLRALFKLAVALIAWVALGTLVINLGMVLAESGRIYDTIAAVPARPVGLVLGTEPGSVFMAERLNAAAQLYQAGKVRHLLVSGGSDGLDYDEARDMWAGLVKRGVPPAAITRDPMGYRTLDSMARAKQVYGLSGVILITQGFHLPRAVFLARHWGLDAVGFAATDPDGFISQNHFRDWLARVLAVLDVEVWNRQPRVGGPPQPITLPAVSPS
jgi:vancomycin permeability regulator SanA